MSTSQPYSTAAVLPAATRLGAAALTVSNLDRSLAFYHNTLGFQVHRTEGRTATLGAGETDLLVLVEDAEAPRKPATRGLYHVAFVVPSRAALARVLMHFIDKQTPLQGLSDHFVSEAIYLADPDGLGLEIYRDRPRSEWEYERGVLNIGTVAMDVRGVLNEHLQGAAPAWYGMEPGTQVGHMHMHAEEVPRAEAFYREVLGFELITRFSHFASFLAAGGYHHHIAVREGTGPALAGAIDLRWYTIQLPDSAAQDAVAARLAAAGFSPQQTTEGDLYADSAGNRFRLAVAH